MEKEIIAITTRYPKALVEALKHVAQDHHRSFNGEVIQALQEYIKRQKAGKRDASRL